MGKAKQEDQGSQAQTFARVPFNRMAGFRLVQSDSSRAEVTLNPTAAMEQEHGVVHGGMLAALADTAAVYLIHPSVGEEQRMASVEFKVNFLGPARVSSGPLRAVATPVKLGRRVAVCRSEVWQDEHLILTGLFTYLRFAPSRK